jgi:hypothetical protein
MLERVLRGNLQSLDGVDSELGHIIRNCWQVRWMGERRVGCRGEHSRAERHGSKVEESRGEESRAGQAKDQSRGEESRAGAGQSKGEQSRGERSRKKEQSRVERRRAEREHSRAEQRRAEVQSNKAEHLSSVADGTGEEADDDRSGR